MPFGGITMLLCGDFRQTLPVIPRAGPVEVISSTINVLNSGDILRAFADYLLQVGGGRHFISPTSGPDFIKVPEGMVFNISSLPHSNIEEQARNRLLHLVETVYTDLNSGNHPDDYSADRIILTPKNTDVLAINNLILEKIPGEMHEFTSVDSVDGDDGFNEKNMEISIHQNS
ncbi:Helitron helicase [Phytophthora megakarya]|uniref:ATP-dependent DNA helicase n=1 Tax=Phytophthora megakarya TaxID=4795 RepID=A0A225VPN4_9STRA|nr:Helitron helicase [Phytophthora megakarya]